MKAMLAQDEREKPSPKPPPEPPPKPPSPAPPPADPLKESEERGRPTPREER